MLSLITDSKKLAHQFIKLLEKYQNIAFATAWASSEHSAFKELLRFDCKEKIKHSTIGLHFYQTSPEVLDSFKEHDQIRFILQTDGVFHPKIYLFWNDENDWILLSGSANFTNGAFAGDNKEAMIMVSESSSEFFHEIKDFLEIDCFLSKHAKTLTDEDIYKYRALYQLRKKSIQTLSNIYQSDNKLNKMKKNILETNILTYSWDKYLNVIKKDKHHSLSGRLEILAYVQQIFQNSPNFLSIDLETRKFIAGLPNHDVKNFDYGWFGSNKSNGNFANKINSGNRQFAEAIDQIPLTGEVSRTDFLEYNLMCKSAGYKNPIGISTRLLTMKRPDLFFCFNGANKLEISKELGISNAQNINAERYWDEILMRIYDTLWFNSNKPKGAEEIAAWNGRVALIDCIYYNPNNN